METFPSSIDPRFTAMDFPYGHTPGLTPITALPTIPTCLAPPLIFEKKFCA